MSVRDQQPDEKGPDLATRRIVAAFDFDGTLTSGGSVWQFLVYIAGRARVLLAGLLDLPKLSIAAVAGGSANDSAKEALYLRVLRGRDASDVSRRAAEFGLSHFRRRGRSEVRDRLEWHKTQGHRVVIVSASPEIYVSAVAAELGADAVIATRLEVEDGRLTGHYEGKNCRGAEKERRLREWIAGETSASSDRTRDEPFVWAYGNSAGDLEMLRDADVGVNVGRLGRFGKLRGFRSLGGLSGSGQPGTDAAPTTLPS